MDFQLNMKNLSSCSSRSSTVKSSFHGRKLQYQDRISEQPAISQQTATLSPTYLTADWTWKTVTNAVVHKSANEQKRKVKSNTLKIFSV